MHLDFTKEESQDIEAFVSNLTLSKEKYFLCLHKKNVLTKEALQDRPNFRCFIEDYHHMLENLYDYNFVIKDMIEHNNDTKIIDSILYFLDTTIKDPMVLSQLYAIYKKQNENDPSLFQ